tara:strand:+ start:619 stop:882 length:264 start_codon:yes stop_codon:yes gene_type:complete
MDTTLRDVEALPSPSEWIEDNDVKHCHICEEEFSLLTRKHHCRGSVVLITLHSVLLFFSHVFSGINMSGANEIGRVSFSIIFQENVR